MCSDGTVDDVMATVDLPRYSSKVFLGIAEHIIQLGKYDGKSFGHRKNGVLFVKAGIDGFDKLSRSRIDECPRLIRGPRHFGGNVQCAVLVAAERCFHHATKHIVGVDTKIIIAIERGEE